MTPEPPRHEMETDIVVRVPEPGDRIELRLDAATIASWECEADGQLAARLSMTVELDGTVTDDETGSYERMSWPHVYADLLVKARRLDPHSERVPEPRIVHVAAPDPVELRRQLAELLGLDDGRQVVMNDEITSAVVDVANGAHAAQAHLDGIRDVLRGHPPVPGQRAAQLGPNGELVGYVRALADLAFGVGADEHVTSLAAVVAEGVEKSATGAVTPAETARRVIAAGWRPPIGWQPSIVDQAARP